MFGIQGDQLITMVSFDFEDRDWWPVLVKTTDGGTPPKSYQVIA